jgi:hypothetical protein
VHFVAQDREQGRTAAFIRHVLHVDPRLEREERRSEV